MKARTRCAAEACAADCGHFVAAGHAVVRRGRRWVCTRCSLPPSRPGMARCGACGLWMGLDQRIALRPDGRWCHRECCPDRPLAVARVTDGYAAGFSAP